MPETTNLRKFKREQKAFNDPKQVKLDSLPDTTKKERCRKKCK